MRFPNPCRVGDTVVFSAEVTGLATAEGRDFITVSVIAATEADKVVAKGTIRACLT